MRGRRRNGAKRDNDSKKHSKSMHEKDHPERLTWNNGGNKKAFLLQGARAKKRKQPKGTGGDSSPDTAAATDINQRRVKKAGFFQAGNWKVRQAERWDRLSRAVQSSQRCGSYLRLVGRRQIDYPGNRTIKAALKDNVRSPKRFLWPLSGGGKEGKGVKVRGLRTLLRNQE